MAAVPAEEGEKLHAASILTFKLPPDSIFYPGAANPGAVSEEESRRLYDKLKQCPHLDIPSLRETQEHDLAVRCEVLFCKDSLIPPCPENTDLTHRLAVCSEKGRFRWSRVLSG